MEPNDKRILSYLPKIVDVIPSRKDGQQRELLIVLQTMNTNASLDGKIIDTCINIWMNKKNVSFRYNAFKLLTKISKKYPELSREIKLLVDAEYTDDLSATAKRSILRLAN